MNPSQAGIFRRGSTTFYNSSRFFTPDVRADVTTLYAFVRLADDFVDAVPQDGAGFTSFRHAYDLAAAGGFVERPAVTAFAALAQRQQFDRAWIECFLDTMQQDLWKRTYETLDETLAYTHGSAEVVGLMMARIMDLPSDAEPYARLLGRAFQYVNFIRDIREDAAMGRTYLPRETMREAGLPDLNAETARRQPEAFERFVRSQIGLYRAWQQEGLRGLRYIPGATAVPIRTAAEMYDYTARAIERDPFVVFRRKVKPARSRIVLMAGKHKLAQYLHGLPHYERANDTRTDGAGAHP